MASLSWKIKKYLENNSKVYETERDSGNFSVVNLSDGNGDIIETWNVSGVSTPTTSQLNSVDSSATTDFNNFKMSLKISTNLAPLTNGSFSTEFLPINIELPFIVVSKFDWILILFPLLMVVSKKDDNPKE